MVTPGDDGVRENLERLAVAAKRDRDSLESLIRLDYERLFRVCRPVLRDPGAAEDATQEAVLSIARHISRFDEKSRYTTWSYRIAVNASLDELRRRRLRPVVMTDDLTAEIGADTGFENDVTTRLDVFGALERLSTEQEEVLRLRHLLDLDYSEIATVLQIPIGTVRSRIARGRKGLSKLLITGNDTSEGNPSPSVAVEVERPR